MNRITWIYPASVLAVALAAGCGNETGTAGVTAGRTVVAAAADSSSGWIGKTAGGFALPGIDGKTVDVGKVLGTKPVVLVFYRGVW